MLLFPLRRSPLTPPFFRMPDTTAGDDWVYLFDILTATPMWDDFRKRKQRYDPDGILSPGSGIFS